jgi:hypothetical protein
MHAVYLQELLGSPSTAADVPSHKLALSQVVATPELVVDLTQFPLDGEIFTALQARIETVLPPRVELASASSSSSVASTGPLTSISPHSLYRWLLGELKWRSVAVLESLLTNSSAPSSLAMPRPTRSISIPFSSSSDASTSADEMFIRIGQLLVSHARQCQLELKLEVVSHTNKNLEQQAWNMRNRVDAVIAPVPYQRGRGVAQVAASQPHPNSFETVYSSSSYREEKIQAPVASSLVCCPTRSTG